MGLYYSRNSNFPGCFRAINVYNTTTVTADVTGTVEEGTEATVEIFANGDLEVDAAATQKVEIEDGSVEAVFTGLPAGSHIAVVTVGDSSESVEFTVEEFLNITSIDTLNENGVTITFTEIPVAWENATIEVIDNEGNVVEVDSVDLVEGETLATFDFATQLADAPEGVWTINGVEYDLDFLELLSDVNNSGSDLELYQALQEIGSKNLVVANADEYFAEFGSRTADFTSFEEIQEFLDEVNLEVLENGNTEEIIEAIEEALVAGNSVQLLAALESFDRVNPDYVGLYDTAIDNGATLNEVEFTTLNQIQDAIDEQNLLIAEAAVNAAELSNADRDDYNNAVEALSFVGPDEENDDPMVKAELQDRLLEVDRVLRVFEATTPAQLTVAYNNLVALVDNEDVLGDAPFYSAARTAYLFELNSGGAITAASVENAIVNGNRVAQFDALADLDALAVDANTSTVLNALQALAAVTEEDDFDYTDVRTDADSVEAYRDNIRAIATYGVADNEIAPSFFSVSADVQDVVNAINLENNPPATSEMAVVDAQATTPTNSTDLLTDLEALPERFNVDEDNAVAYFNNSAIIANALDGTSTDEANLIAVINAVNEIETLESATTASEARTALTNLAFNSYVDGNSAVVNYIDLTSAQKLEVAASLLDADFSTANIDTIVASIFDTVTPAVNGVVAEYLNLLAAVNASDTISEAQLALDAIEYDAFDDLTPQRQVEVAEAFLEAFPMTTGDAPARINYESLTAIEAAIDAAINATN